MNKQKTMQTLFYIFLLPLGILLFNISSYKKIYVESFYSKELYKFVSQLISNVTGIMPFSIGELVVLLLIIFLLYKFIGFILLMSKIDNKSKFIIEALLNTLKFVAIAYFVFIIIWGLNYNRIPFADIAGLKVAPASTGDLKKLCEVLITQANTLRSSQSYIQRDSNIESRGYKNIFGRAHLGYLEAGKIYPELGGKYGAPKSVFMSEFLCYAGISGIYFPFTAEANVNTKIPYIMLPSTTCHEMAHQRGFAREDEANYIAYVTCMNNPNNDFKYSGTILALTYSMNALQKYDFEAFKELTAKYSYEVRQDLININHFWAKYDGPIEKTSDRINNTYLKANMQKDGVHSYGRMIDLMIAAQRETDNK